MLDRLCKFLLAQIEQFLPSIEIGRLPRFLKIPARLALVLIGWVVRHTRLLRCSVCRPLWISKQASIKPSRRRAPDPEHLRDILLR
jgi:hypothetical protein